MQVFTYGDIHALLGNSLETAHDVLLHLDELRKLLGQIGTESATGVATEGMAWKRFVSRTLRLWRGGAAIELGRIEYGATPAV